MYRRGLARHVRRNHTDHPVFDCNQCDRSFARPGNLENHKRTCTGGAVAVPAAKKQRIDGAVPVAAAEKRRIAPVSKCQESCKSRGGAVEQFTVNMKEVNHLSALEKAKAVFPPVIATFQRGNRVYNFLIAVYVVFHKAVDPAVATQPPVTLTSEIVAVYSDASPPLGEVYRQLLNFIEVYEHNGSGWVFSNFASLQLTLWHLDPVRASAFVPLPRWAVLAGIHPVDKLARAHVNPHRMATYEEHVTKYDFPSLRFPVPLSSIGPFATTNNLSINVYGVENDEKVI